MDERTRINAQLTKELKVKSFRILHRLDQASENAVNVNQSLLMRIVKDNQDTEFGKKYGFARITDPDCYRKKVPLSSYDDYETTIQRMMEKGEKNLLTSYPVSYYAITGGTTGASKYLPVSDRGIQTFVDYASSITKAVISEYYQNTKLHDEPAGFSLTLLNVFKKNLPDGSQTGCISASCINQDVLDILQYLRTTPKEAMCSEDMTNPKYLHAFYALSERNVTIITGPYIPILLDLVNYILAEWPHLVEDIRKGQIDPALQIPQSMRDALQARLKPNPERADELEREFSKGFDHAILRRIWPNLSSVAMIWAGNFSSYARKLQKYTGRSIPYYTTAYSSSEGTFAVARHPHDQYYVMTPDTCFFEFIPIDDQAGKDENSEPATLLMDEVQEGRDYELVITNQSGLYRYRMGDVVRVTGFYNESPMITFQYRTKNVISIVGEHFTEDHLFSAIKGFERRTGINIIDYCMYPDRDVTPVRYAILLEPDEPVPHERHYECIEILQQELKRASNSYSDYFGDNILGMPKLVFLQSQSFQLYREIKMYKTGISENQLKPVHILTTPELIRFFTGLEEKSF